MLSPFPILQKRIFLSIFGAAAIIKLVLWYHYRSALGFPSHIPMIFWEGTTLISLLIWNPKGIRLVLLALLGFLIYNLVLFNFFVGGLSSLPFWYLFRDVYALLHVDSFFAFFVESVLLLLLTLSIFPFGKRPAETDLLDN